jgi:hypothetical protein
MIRRFPILVPVAMLLVCGLTDRISSETSAQQTKRANKPLMKADYVKSTAKVEIKKPGHLGTTVGGLDDADPEFARVVRRHFEKAPIPASRLTAFAMFDQPNYRVDGWHVAVSEIEKTREGTIVKVGVWPLVTSTFGASTCVSAAVFEWYRVDKTGVHLLKTDPPAGESAIVAIFTD